MVLEEKFHDKITSLIHKTLKSNEISSPELKQKVWGYQYDDDFKYGHKAGFLIGLIIGDYMETYQRFLSSHELIEIKKIIIYCDGDFWHGYKYDEKKKPAKKFWRDKIKGNMKRDGRITRKLRRDGWAVLRFWEHDIERNPEKCMRRIKIKIKERSRTC